MLIFGVFKQFIPTRPPPRFLQPCELARIHQGESVTAVWISFSQALDKDASSLAS